MQFFMHNKIGSVRHQEFPFPWKNKIPHVFVDNQ